ncbi:hypothetical protein [Sinorhizobium sp. RAC02]|uniref:hypothetical protein n=1 Tax=Sinorhizobium sp. RAC02 TaxID=1842534 RepID=UPI0025704F36|nr:hypothetical protein [Sinorhizobium sp. RAC02]
MEAFRHLGIGAGAVSGFYSMPMRPRTVPTRPMPGTGFYLPGVGWNTFDPTHRRMAAPISSRWRSPAAIARSCRS